MEKFEKNNLTIALVISYPRKEKVFPAHVSKHNSNHEKQVIILYYSKKITGMIKRNSVKKRNWFLLSELPSFFGTENKRKQTKHYENRYSHILFMRLIS